MKINGSNYTLTEVTEQELELILEGLTELKNRYSTTGKGESYSQSIQTMRMNIKRILPGENETPA